MKEKQLLQQAIQAIQNGDKKTGEKLLIQILNANPKHETAWMWMSTTVDDPELRRECLEKVLEINPKNEAAHKYLYKLQTSQGPIVSTAGHRTSGKCGICAKSTSAPENRVAYTAITAGQTRRKTFPNEDTVTTYYQDFQSHPYRVCDSCEKIWDRIVPAFIYTPAVLIILPVVAHFLPSVWESLKNWANNYSGALFNLLMTCVCFPFFPLFIAYTFAEYLGIDSKLARKALAYRKKFAGRRGVKYEGFTQSQFQKLQKT